MLEVLEKPELENAELDNDVTSDPEGAPNRPASGLASVLGQDFSIEASIGGVRGMVESVLPVGAFTVAYLMVHQVVIAAGIAVAVAAILLVARIVQRQVLTPAISGLLAPRAIASRIRR